MTAPATAARARRWQVPEVVQTSAMDCGPAALKCLLEGFGVNVSYGRLREACQTDVDGTSIDTLEEIANQLGLVAEQVMLPLDHLFLRGIETLPALVVVRHPGGGTHFVVVWRRIGPWLLVMDPAVGRRWVTCRRFDEEIFRHEASVPAAEWRSWAGTDAFLAPLRARLARIGARGGDADALVAKAMADPGWFTLGALDASLRLIDGVVRAGGIAAGAPATRLLGALFEQTRTNTRDIFKVIPPAYWSVSPDPKSVDRTQQRLTLRGAVLLRVLGRRRDAEAATRGIAGASSMSRELVAALDEKPTRPLQALWEMLRADGILRPLALAGAMAIAAGAVLVETLLFRGLFDIADMLTLPSQRLVAALALLAFVALLLAIDVPIMAETMRFGRTLELRLRMALLRKLPELPDRYFQSRPVSDMAERSHAIHLIRLVPGMAIHFVQSLCELGLTLAGIVLIAPESAAIALAIAVVAIGAPALVQPMVNERDLRVRSHLGAIGSFYLDALRGLAPARTHRAEPAIERQHESLLVEWVRSSRRLLRLSIFADGAQSLLCIGLAGGLLIQHFLRSGGVTGSDLLLAYWTLKLPAIGHGIAMLAHQYPMQRNVLLRLLEPLSAPEDAARTPAPVASAERPAGAPAGSRGAAIAVKDGSVLVAGRTVLEALDLAIAPGEHVAIVGVSGAGKSTLVGLLLGWYRLSDGELRVDGAPFTAAAQEALRRHTAWVDPAIQVWNRSFVENLSYASPDDGLSRIGDVVDAATLRGVLRALPDGLQTRLGEGGALLSGGEGQRVRLGRAFMQDDVRLALLDEPFRGMDRPQRSALLAFARRHWRDATLLCVTHDVGETRLFDRVLVVEAGRVIEDDAPSRLAERPSRYRDLLEAEREVRERMWASKDWRRIAIRDGRAEESS
ncbi:MAG: ATP-binding cassette domain-containing protein [Alphaproteobacteria bacterium]|nr:ATP-binding cassette domain-containing protein [Alphaproteobacteria bacterium]